jgi:hypothetical protein
MMRNRVGVRHGGIVATVVLVAVLAGAAAVLGYEPYKFSGKYEQYAFKTTSEGEVTFFTLTIDPKGGEKYMVKVEYEKELAQEDLGEALFAGAGMMSVQWMMFFNPMVFMYLGLGGDELQEVGDKFIIPGGGKIQYTGNETIAGQKGKVFVTTVPDEEETVIECVLSESLALPLRVTAKEGDNLQYEVVLTSYKTK